MKIFWQVSEQQKPLSGGIRYKNEDKVTILKKSWLSLQANIDETDQIFIIHDNISKETREWLVHNASGMHQLVKVSKHKKDYRGEKVKLYQSIKKEIKNSNSNEILFAIEDDYLFLPDAFQIIRDTMKYWGGFVIPTDFPDNYKYPVYSTIYVGPERHWRTIGFSGHTLAARAEIWELHIENLIKAAPVNNLSIFSDIFKVNPGICPLPGVATELEEAKMTPLVPWEQEWKKYEIC